MSLSSIQSANYTFPDKRLSTRFEKIVSTLGIALKATIPQAFGSKKQTDAAYSFFKHPKNDLTGIFEEHRSTFLPIIKSGAEALRFEESTRFPNRLLWLSDTVELDYSNKRNAALLGPLTSLKRRGLYVHNGLLVNSLGSPVGLANQKYIIRTDEDWAKSEERKYHPIETKESYKWIEDCEAAESLVEHLHRDATDDSSFEIVHITDREGDINELFQTKQHPNLHQIIRAQHNRVLVTNNKGKTIKVKAHLSKLPVAEYQMIEVTCPVTKRKKKVEVSIKFSTIKIKMRKGFGAKYYKDHNITPPNRPYQPSIRIQIVQAKQLDPLDNIDDPIEWILFTTLPVNEPYEAKVILQYYRHRWIIERFHYLLKSGGAQVEELNFKRVLQLKNALVAYSLAAMDVLRIKYLAENQPDLRINQVGILPIQHEVLYNYVHQYVDKKIQYLPDEIPTIKEFCIVLGKMSGFILSKKNPIPGLKILARAWIQLDIMVKSYKLSCQRTDE